MHRQHGNEMVHANQRYVTYSPSARLREFVSHYWLSLDNPDVTYTALPDGAVDLVVHVDGRTARSWVYGTTTLPTDISLQQHSHYLGIRFRPGQSRHFINAMAHELTDRHEAANHVLRFSLDEVPERLGSGDVTAALDRHLENHLAKWQPTRNRIDDVIDYIECFHGARKVSDAAAVFGRSRRQFERVFLETVGVSAKFFSRIMRVCHAAALIAASSRRSLAEVAAHTGYADQSHMNHDFRELTRISPGRLGHDVAFLQDCHF